MHTVTLPLMICVFLLALLNYLKLLYNSKRKLKIVERVKDADGNKMEENVVKKYPQAPGPTFFMPILGHVVHVAKYPLLTIAFNELSKKYGDIYSMKLGTTNCVIISSLDLMIDLLSKHGNSIEARPNLTRSHQLFDDNYDKSLALWSEIHKKHRFFSHKHCIPEGTELYDRICNIGYNEMSELMDQIATNITPGKDYNLKPLISKICFNIFTQYICSVKFDYDEPEFQNIVRTYDNILWKINEENILNFIPWMQPFYRKHTKLINSWSNDIRHFIMNRIIEPNNKTEDESNNLDDDFDEYGVNEPDSTDLFMLEDFLAGHSALSNFVIQVFGYIALNPDAGEGIQKEIDRITLNGSREVHHTDDVFMPYTMSTIYESLRFSSSPIVPHAVIRDMAIAGYGIPKDTIIFFNGYALNKSSEYWSNEPDAFKSERFLMHLPSLKAQTSKPIHRLSHMKSSFNSGDSFKRNNSQAGIWSHNNEKLFMPINSIVEYRTYNMRKRTCLVQYMIRCYSFMIVTHILQKYNVSVSDPKLIKMNLDKLALPYEGFPITLIPRICQ